MEGAQKHLIPSKWRDGTDGLIILPESIWASVHMTGWCAWVEEGGRQLLAKEDWSDATDHFCTNSKEDPSAVAYGKQMRPENKFNQHPEPSVKSRR